MDGDEWVWVGDYFGWLGENGEIFLIGKGDWGWMGVGMDEWGCVHSLIISQNYLQII